jgi:tRNA-dihydrouridine synthase A
VKHRIGIDDMDSYDGLARFVDRVAQAGCRIFIVHARKAWLHGLSPKENREVPPLQYNVVHRLKREFPQLEIVINGGFKTLPEAEEQLTRLDGVMIGREAYQNPWILAEADSRIFDAPSNTVARAQVVRRMLPYIEQQCAAGIPLHNITRHMLGLFQGQRGARAWRRFLSEQAHRPGRGPEVLSEALALLG